MLYRLGPKGYGFKMAMEGLDGNACKNCRAKFHVFLLFYYYKNAGGRLCIGACSLGAAQVCTEISLQYVKVNGFYLPFTILQ